MYVSSQPFYQECEEHSPHIHPTLFPFSHLRPLMSLAEDSATSLLETSSLAASLARQMASTWGHGGRGVMNDLQ